MKTAAVSLVLLTLLLVSSPEASAKAIPIHFGSRTLSCRTTDIQFAISPSIGTIAIGSGSNELVAATTRGAWISKTCKRLRPTEPQKAFLPRPSYSGEGAFDCSTPSPLVVHVHYLRTGSRIRGIYVSARTRNGRYIVAGLLTDTGLVREYIASSCEAR